MTRTAAALATWLTAATAAAQPAAPPDDGVEALARSLRDRTLPSLEGLGGDVAVAWSVVLPAGAPDPEGLGRRLVAPLVAELRASERFGAVQPWTLAGGTAAEEAARRGAVRGYDAVVHVEVGTRGSFLDVRVTTLRAARLGGFADLFRPAPERVGSFEVRARLDAHLRRYVGSLPRVTEANLVARSVALPGRGYVAMAAADLDGDGRTELVLARPGTVDVVRLGSTARGTPRAVAVGSATPADLPAPAWRPRRPIGAAVAAGRAVVVVRTSEHGAPFEVRMTDGAVVAARASGPCADEAYPLSDGCAVPVTGRDWFQDGLVGRSGEPAPSPAPSGFYARVARPIPVPDGSTRAVEAVVTPRGRLAVRIDEHPGGAVGYGAALGMTDLEDDGLAELLVSSGAPVGTPDRLSLLRVRADGAVIAVWSSEEMEGAVLVAGAADLDDDGREELIAIEEPPGADAPARLWVVQ